jgi:hypothetical protein
MCLVFAGLFFVSCDKEDDNGFENSLIDGGKFTVNVENGASYNSQIDSVYVKLYCEIESKRSSDIVAKTPYSNGNFTITLPENLDAKYLEYFEFEDLKDYITISDKTAKYVEIGGFQAIKNGETVGYIEKSNISPNADYTTQLSAAVTGIYSVTYMYADKPVTIKGSWEEEKKKKEEEGTESYKYTLKNSCNVSLQKGWNVVVNKKQITIANQKITSETVEISNSEPAGLKWYCSYYGNNSTYSTSAKTALILKRKLF